MWIEQNLSQSEETLDVCLPRLGSVLFLVAPEQTDSITLSCLEQFETDERIVLLLSLMALKAALNL